MPTYAGKPTCDCGAAWLPVFDRLLATYGVKVRWTQLIGGYGPSAGTHSGASFDGIVYERGKNSLDTAYTIVVRIARRMGGDATWERPANWDGRGGIRHVHGLLTGCPHHSWQATNQITAVRNGRNGLANNGPDTGRAYAFPGPRITGRTWREGIAWAEKQLAKKEGIFMGLSDGEQKKLARQVDYIYGQLAPKGAVRSAIGYIRDQLLPGGRVRSAIGSTAKDAESLTADIGKLDDAEVRRIAKASADEAARRAAKGA